MQVKWQFRTKQQREDKAWRADSAKGVARPEEEKRCDGPSDSISRVKVAFESREARPLRVLVWEEYKGKDASGKTMYTTRKVAVALTG